MSLQRFSKVFHQLIYISMDLFYWCIVFCGKFCVQVLVTIVPTPVLKLLTVVIVCVV